jgi:2-polyprenyl-3-methyl-5-hydroxy-6-metoxy-1,4-benzoquinol methylase
MHSCPLCNFEKTDFFILDFRGNRYRKCERCGFVFQRPVSGVRSDADMWTAAVDPDGRKRDLTKERDFKLRNWYGGILKDLAQTKPGRIIDVGCGLGYLLSALPPSWEKYGFDISGFARSFVKANFPDIRLVDDLGLDRLPPAHHRGMYDVVVCYHVIEHIAEPDSFLKHLSALLKKDGTLIIGTPNIGSIAARVFKGNFRLLGDGHLSLFNRKNLGLLMKRHGLKIYKKEYPFFKTDYFKFKSIIAMLNPRTVSPPFYGSIMTFYAKK